jgi:hypothetical protein
MKAELHFDYLTRLLCVTFWYQWRCLHIRQFYRSDLRLILRPRFKVLLIKIEPISVNIVTGKICVAGFETLLWQGLFFSLRLFARERAQHFICWESGTLFQGIRRPEREVGDSPPVLPRAIKRVGLLPHLCTYSCRSYYNLIRLILEYNFCCYIRRVRVKHLALLRGFPLSPRRGSSLGFEWTRRPIHMEGSCGYIDESATDCRKGASLQFGSNRTPRSYCILERF